MNNIMYKLVKALPPILNQEKGTVALGISFDGKIVEMPIDYGKEMNFDYQQDDIFLLITNTMACFFEMFSEKVEYEEFHFDCTRRMWNDLRFNSQVSFKFLQECGVITKKDFPEPLDVKYAEYPAWTNYKMFDKRSKIAVSFSGGNESTLTMDILDDLDYKVTPISIVKPDDFDACNVPRFKDRIKGVSADLSQIFSMLHPTMMKYEDIYLYTYVPLLLLIESVFLESEGFEYMIVGDEFDCSFKMYTRDGLPVHSKNCYDQSNIFKRRLTQYLQDLGWNIQVLSILEPLYTTGILALVDQYCPDDEKKYIFSCFYPQFNDEGPHPCNKCFKCKRIAGLFYSLDIDETKYGYKFNEKWKASPEDLFNSFGCQEEYEALNYRLKKKGHEGFGLDSKNFESALGINVDQVWANIWGELPREVQKAIVNGLSSYKETHV